MDISIRPMSKKSVVVLGITILITLVLQGNGFWALGQPEWSGGIDRLTYIQAARNFFARENLYIDIHQPLPPALLFVLHFFAVIALFLTWKAIFKRYQLDIPIWILPFWFAFSPFVYDAVTLNVNTFMALLATFAQRFTYWNLPPGLYEYSNSLYRVIIYLVGNIKAGITTAQFVQLGFFVLLAVIFARTIFRKRTDDNIEEQDQNLIRWFFVFYCATLLYPPLNFDFSLGIPMFLFLATQGRLQKIPVGIPLLIVAFQDIIWIIVSFFRVAGWFSFIFADTVIARIFLLSLKPGFIHEAHHVSLATDNNQMRP